LTTAPGVTTVETVRHQVHDAGVIREG